MQVIIADDDRLSRRILEDRCREWGFDVWAVEDGNLAWDIYIQQDAPRIFLLDWIMPGINGVDLCEKMRKSPHTSYSYIVIVTSLNDATNIIRGLEAGADDYIVKPFNINELRCRLNIGKRILELEDNILRMANLDYLTGLYNRRYFFQRMECELSRCRRENHPVGLLMIDIDNFKIVNDTYGHTAGDHVLSRLSKVLSRCCRDYDLVGRFGGEEFIICLPGSGREETFKIAERIRGQVAEETLDCNTELLKITVSIGYVSTMNGKSQEMISAADAGLYAAKKAGKNCSVTVTIPLSDLNIGSN
ncbi:MAG: GGDEF domain-containing protein [Methylocystaceae bacterium]